jgi:hypothetical protein
MMFKNTNRVKVSVSPKDFDLVDPELRQIIRRKGQIGAVDP